MLLSVTKSIFKKQCANFIYHHYECTKRYWYRILGPIYKFHTLKQRHLIVLWTHSLAKEEGGYNSMSIINFTIKYSTRQFKNGLKICSFNSSHYEAMDELGKAYYRITVFNIVSSFQLLRSYSQFSKNVVQ